MTDAGSVPERLDLRVPETARGHRTRARLVVAGTADMLGLRWVVWEGRMPPKSVLDQVRALLDVGFRGVIES